jgi:peroxiredoxin
MSEKLQQGDRLPDLTLNLIDGRTLALPDAMSSRYLALLFYRGVW